jgi:hypothetical protein
LIAEAGKRKTPTGQEAETAVDCPVGSPGDRSAGVCSAFLTTFATVATAEDAKDATTKARDLRLRVARDRSLRHHE